MRETALALMPQAAAISAAVQRVLSPGGGLEVNATTRSATSGPSGAMREGRVLSRSKPSTPSCMNRSCQRQTQVLDLRVRRMISLVPRPSAESSTTSARQTCFCGALRSFKITFSRLRSEGFNVMDIPVRMRQTRTSGAAWESQMGFKCQTGTTRRLRPPRPGHAAPAIAALTFRKLARQAGSMNATDLKKLADWLIDGARSLANPADVMAETCERLVRSEERRV